MGAERLELRATEKKKHVTHKGAKSIEMEHQQPANPKQIHSINSIHSHRAMSWGTAMGHWQMGPSWDVRLRWDMNRALTDAFSAALPSDS